jgi:hypothetical protein
MTKTVVYNEITYTVTITQLNTSYWKFKIGITVENTNSLDFPSTYPTLDIASFEDFKTKLRTAIDWYVNYNSIIVSITDWDGNL